MKRLYGLLIAIAASFVFLPLAAAADTDGDEHPVQRWDQQINNTSRLKVLSAFGGKAVLDSETGLVWQKSPSTSTFSWGGAQAHCNRLTTGGRLGWRLPTLQELESLVDPNAGGVAFLPLLPAGNPFENVRLSSYWSATTNANVPGDAWDVNFSNGDVNNNGNSVSFVWCVRGGQGVDAQ